MPYWRLSGFYFFYFALLGAIVPYWNLYLSTQGYTAREIGLLGAILMGTKVFSPYLLGWLADKTHQPMRAVRWSNFAALLLFLPIFLLNPSTVVENHRFLYLAAVVAGFTFFWNAVIAQYEAVTVLSLKLSEQTLDYGRIRVWGSIGFIIAVSGLGWLFENTSINLLPLAIAFILLTIWLSSLGAGEMQPAKHEKTNTGGFIEIIKQPYVIAFFAGCFLVKLAHGPYYTFYSIYLDAYGYSKSLIGLLWSGGVIAEVILFLVIGHLLNHFSLRAILVFSLAVGIIRWAVIGFYPTNISLLVLAQTGHAFTFASYHAAAIEWVRRVFGHRHQGQGQALYSAISFGAGSSAGAVISGLLWTDEISTSWQMTWLLAAGVSIVGLLIFARYANRHQG